jgi:5-methylcytosine-specific restriction enzyme A
MAMTLKADFQDELERTYLEAGERTGYWGKRFIQKVRRVGGVRTAKDMLAPRTAAQRKGLDAILAAGRPDLSLEYIVSKRRFRSLFTQDEIREAKSRLLAHRREAAALVKNRENIFPDESDPRETYPAGSRRSALVNAFERNPQARAACIAHHGTTCAVCELNFEDRYGRIGADFIHVHHLRLASQLPDGYTIDPKRDLVPVCPNCHAMMHYRTVKPRTVGQLRRILRTG